MTNNSLLEITKVCQILGPLPDGLYNYLIMKKKNPKILFGKDIKYAFS